MKRFTGLLLALAGGAATLWGGYKAISGQTSTPIALTEEYSISAMVLGLSGLAVLTIGLVWMRD